METPEKDDPVWKLLDEARPVEPGAMFSRNVVREARNTPQTSALGGVLLQLRGFFGTAYRPVLAASAVAAVVAIAVVVSTGPQDTTSQPSFAQVEAVVTEESFDYVEEVDYLGELMAVVDPSEFDDSALADLLF